VAALAGVAWASGGWDEARSKAEDAKRKADETHQAYAQAARKIVGAMCQARDIDHLKDAGRSEASNVRSDVRSKLDTYHRAVGEAIERLDHIDSKDSHHSDASSLERDLKDMREKLDRMTGKIADGSPEFLDEIVRAAESAQSDRRGRCTHKGFSADGDRIGS
jgi:uncharacterized phage infection (PIP) family protein YhgE